MSGASYPRSVRRGYTLLELMIAMVGATTLMAGLSSAIFVAVQAAGTDDSPLSASRRGGAVLSDLLAELEFARSFTETTPTAITMIVPDRDGDTIAETIRYAWSGTPGDPLTRQYNGGAVATLVDNVYIFQHDLPVSTANLLGNADMEAGATLWQAIPGAVMYTSFYPVYSGAGALYCYRNTANNESGVRQDVTAQLDNGQEYSIGGWMQKWSAAQPYDVRIQLHVVSSEGGDQVFATPLHVINNSEFLLVKGTVTPTWSGSLISAYWEATGISKIQDLYLDDAYLRATQTSDQYVIIKLQTDSDTSSLVQSGVRLLNEPL